MIQWYNDSMIQQLKWIKSIYISDQEEKQSLIYIEPRAEVKSVFLCRFEVLGILPVGILKSRENIINMWRYYLDLAGLIDQKTKL